MSRGLLRDVASVEKRRQYRRNSSRLLLGTRRLMPPFEVGHLHKQSVDNIVAWHSSKEGFVGLATLRDVLRAS